MIVKVQLPTFAPAGADLDMALVYAEGRKRMVQAPVGREVRRAMGADVKAFFEATWTGDGWRIGKRVGDQSW